MGRNQGCLERGRSSARWRALALAGLFAATGLLGGCGFFIPDRIHYVWRPEAVAPCENCAPKQREREIVGMAMSGGGSRAAVFAAAVMKQLAAHGLHRPITHISSVSGGGFASSYYVTHPIGRCDAEQSRDARSACMARYFDEYLTAMRANLFIGTIVNQLANPNRITSPTRRASSLQDALDEEFLNGARFGDLPPSPVLLINAASYDDQRRFVFSNRAFDERRRSDEMLREDWLRTSSFSFPRCPAPTPADFPVSLAVTASAGFPPLLGPVTVEARRDCDDPTPRYWHLGDGGIIENTGIETLRELIVRRATAGGLRRALVFVADGGKMRDAEDSTSQRDLSVFTNHTGAVVEVAQARGAAYSEIYWRRKRRELGVPIDTITFRYVDARLTEWPESCGDRRELSGRDEILERMSAIPTDLKIDDCDADLLEAAAAELVPRKLAEARAVLQRHGLR